jgi:hypothetical protein
VALQEVGGMTLRRGIQTALDLVLYGVVIASLLTIVWAEMVCPIGFCNGTDIDAWLLPFSFTPFGLAAAAVIIVRAIDRRSDASSR